MSPTLNVKYEDAKLLRDHPLSGDKRLSRNFLFGVGFAPLCDTLKTILVADKSQSLKDFTLQCSIVATWLLFGTCLLFGSFSFLMSFFYEPEPCVLFETFDKNTRNGKIWTRFVRYVLEV